MGETENLQDGCDRENGSRLIFFRLGPAVAYMSRKNIGFQLPMYDFLSKLVLETKFVPIFSTGHTVFERSNFQYGGKRVLGATGKASSRKTNLDHNKCIKTLILDIQALFTSDKFIVNDNVIFPDSLVNEDTRLIIKLRKQYFFSAHGIENRSCLTNFQISCLQCTIQL